MFTIRTIIVLVLTIYNDGLIWQFSQSSIRPSLYFSSIVKSGSNPFLGPAVLSNKGKFSCSRKQGAFYGARTHDIHITSQTRNPLCNDALITFWAASLMNCLAPSLQIAGTVMTQWTSISSRSITCELIVSIACSFRYLRKYTSR